MEKGKKAMKLRLTRNLLEIIFLTFLDEEPLHGYGINVKFRGAFECSLSASTIYPLLYMMEEEGLINSEWNSESQRKKKVYSITPKGKEHLFHAYNSLVKITKMLERMLNDELLQTKQHSLERKYILTDPFALSEER
jgi:PadR family transcriptional regulator PadR